MQKLFASLFGSRDATPPKKDETTKAVKAAIDRNKQASARLEGVIRDLIAENNRVRTIGAVNRDN